MKSRIILIKYKGGKLYTMNAEQWDLYKVYTKLKKYQFDGDVRFSIVNSYLGRELCSIRFTPNLKGNIMNCQMDEVKEVYITNIKGNINLEFDDDGRTFYADSRMDGLDKFVEVAKDFFYGFTKYIQSFNSNMSNNERVALYRECGIDIEECSDDNWDDEE